MSIHILLSITFLSILLGNTSCKKIRSLSDKSQAKGIENLLAKDGINAFGRSTPPYCGNPIATKAPKRWMTAAKTWVDSLTLTDSNQKQNLKKAALDSIANLPASTLELIHHLKLDLNIHDTAPSHCQTTFKALDPKRQELIKQKFKNTKFSEENHYACFVSQGGTARPVIHIGGNPKLVDVKEKMTQQESFLRRLLVRNIGIAYARFLPQFINENYVKRGEQLVSQVRSQDLPTTKKSTVLNSTNMIADSRKELLQFSDVFSKYKSNLRSTLLTQDKMGESAPIKRVQELIDMQIVDPSEFDDIVFAEIFDSHFCNASTRKFFETNFPFAAKDFAYNAKVMIELVTPKVPKI